MIRYIVFFMMAVHAGYAADRFPKLIYEDPTLLKSSLRYAQMNGDRPTIAISHELIYSSHRQVCGAIIHTSLDTSVVSIWNSQSLKYPSSFTDYNQSVEFGRVSASKYKFSRELYDNIKGSFVMDGSRRYIFVGTTLAGDIATLLSFQFYTSNPHIRSIHREQNIINLMTFYSPGVGDSDFSAGYCFALSPFNALSIEPHASTPFPLKKNVGVPLTIMPFEFMRDNFKKSILVLAGVISTITIASLCEGEKKIYAAVPTVLASAISILSSFDDISEESFENSLLFARSRLGYGYESSPLSPPTFPPSRERHVFTDFWRFILHK